MLLKSLVLAILVGAAAWAAPHLPSPWGTGESNSELRHRLCRSGISLDDDSLHRYDMLKIQPHFTMNPDSQLLYASVIYTLRASQIPLDRVDLRFTTSLTIDSVWSTDTHQITYTREGLDSLQILVSPTLPLNDTLQFGIAYHGTPATIDGWGGFRFTHPQGYTTNMGFSMGDGLNLNPPPANYNWLPSYADPTDKTLWEAMCTLYDYQTGASEFNSVGKLLTVFIGEDHVTWQYRLNQPVSTYLLAIAAGPYQVYVQRDSLPWIADWVYANRMAAAQVHFSNVPTVLDSFAGRFGPFPFDRFGYAMTPIGDMEHATCVYHDQTTVVGNHTYDWLLFHEMSHQWWGDWVTCGDWRDLWLNEGFATYCEALSMEVLHGHDSYDSYVATDLFPTAISTQENFPVYNPDYYWGATVYEKGACVMHMLRQLLGDSAFFAAWREYGQEHAYGNAVTADWQQKLEEHYGGSLQWFFDEWVYTGTRYPQYHVVLELGDVAGLMIYQNQTGNYFRMPIEIQMVDAARDTFQFTVWNDAQQQQGWMITPSDSTFHQWPPRSIIVDPKNKILKTIFVETVAADPLHASLPRTFAISSISPNPFNSTATVHFDLPKSSAVRLQVFDLLGRRVSDMNLGTLAAGSHQLPWDGSSAASGVYLFRLETDRESRIAKAVLLK